MATITLHPTREKSLLRKHPWIFSKAVDSVQGRVNRGDTVDVMSSEGKWLGRGAYSPDSQIRVRIWTFDQNETIDNAFFTRKIERALRLRQSVISRSHTNAYRVVAAEADGLPGCTIDRYNNICVLQLLSAGADKHRDKIVWSLRKLFPLDNIIERSDVAIRQKEGLAPLKQTLHGEVDGPVVISENGINIRVDVWLGHKTGFYLDQRDNRALASSYMQNQRVLNCFSYTGTFATYALANGAQHVTNVDVSSDALAQSEANLALNQLDSDACTHIKADVFEQLRLYAKQKARFDHIILDPPKFVDSKASLNRAARGYKDINMFAMQCIESGGYLSTFSCSGLMSADLFQKIVADAALDANRDVLFIKRYHQAPDHPVSSNYPEGYYLKGLLCQVF